MKRSPLPLARERLCRNTVHGSRASPRTVLLDGKFKYLPARHFDKLSAGSELVEGLQSNCDTAPAGGERTVSLSTLAFCEREG
jgi:hypothetical protein